MLNNCKRNTEFLLPEKKKKKRKKKIRTPIPKNGSIAK